MNLIKKLYRAYRGTEHKKEILYNVADVLRKEGISGLRRTINVVSEIGSQLSMDIYQLQQLTEVPDTVIEISVLFCVIAQGNRADIKATTESIRALKSIDQEIVVFVPRDSGCCCIGKERIVEYADEYKTVMYEVLSQKQYDYVFFVSASDVLAPNMAYEFFSDVSKERLPLLYSDECVEYEKTRRFYLKAEYSEYDWLINGSMGKSVAFPYQKVIALWNQTLGGSVEDLIFSLAILMKKEECGMRHVEKVLLCQNGASQKELSQDEPYPVSLLDARAEFINQFLAVEGNMLEIAAENDRIVLSKTKVHNKFSIVLSEKSEEILKGVIEDILMNTQSAEFEIIALCESEDAAESLSRVYADQGNIKVMCAKGSYAEKYNKAAKAASGEIIVFYDSYSRIKTPDWLETFEKMFAIQTVGAVSPKIIRPENTIKYAGMISGGFGFTPIVFNGETDEKRWNENEPAFVNREVSVLSASCLAVRKSLFEKIHGFDAVNVPEKFSNAVLSYEIGRRGYSCMYCADVTLVSSSGEWYDSFYDRQERGVSLFLLKNYAEELSRDRFFTETMKRQYLRGVPIDFKISCENSVKKKSILMVSHDALLGGATIALEYAAKTLQKNGYYVVFVVHDKGGIVEELEKDHIPYLVDRTAYSSDEWLSYAQDFDIVFLSTIVLGQRISSLTRMNKKVIWWVHEASEYYVNHPQTIENTDHVQVYCGGSIALNNFRHYYPAMDAKILIYGVPDYYEKREITKSANERMVFLSIGTIEKRKGQDILAEAIRLLPEEDREICTFHFIGKVIQDSVYESIVQLQQCFPDSVQIHKPMNRSRLMELYMEADCVVCSSREDPMPVFMTECMMMERVPICSENAGTASLIQHGRNGYVYSDNNPVKLAAAIHEAVRNRNCLREMGQRARKTYQDYLSLEQFEKKIINEIRGLI